MQNLARLVTRVFAALKKSEWLPILLARLAMGYEFVSSGWGKLHALYELTAYFVQLKIPAPGFNAVLTATTEFVCGLILIAGLGPRFAAAPLGAVLFVATLPRTLEGAPTLRGCLDPTQAPFCV